MIIVHGIAFFGLSESSTIAVGLRHPNESEKRARIRGMDPVFFIPEISIFFLVSFAALYEQFREADLSLQPKGLHFFPEGGTADTKDLGCFTPVVVGFFKGLSNNLGFNLQTFTPHTVLEKQCSCFTLLTNRIN